MCSKQCMGITKKGAQCLIKVNSGEFCHHHVPSQKCAKTRPNLRHDMNQTPKQRTSNYSSSLPATPKKAKQPSHMTSKYYTTLSNPHPNSASSSPAIEKHSQSPIKYDNIERPVSRSAGGSPRRPRVDYASIPSSPKLRYSPKVELAIQPGYIYVYTLSSFLSKHADGGWIQTRNLSQSKRKQDQWVDVDMRRSPKMLIKVGMTTKTPAVRIQQWESKCNHKLQCLYPGSHPDLGKSSLSRMFGDLSLSDKEEGKQYSTYVEHHQGFFVPRNILHCEQSIHHILKSKFGRGEIHCKGCRDKSQEQDEKQPSILDIFRSKKETAKTDYNIHNEWFPIPRKNLNEVFSIINTECMKYMP